MGIRDSILEEICEVIGYTATITLQAWFGPGSLYVPGQVKEGHPITAVLGAAAAGRLVEAYGDSVLHLPYDDRQERTRRNRMALTLFELGASEEEVARVALVSPVRVRQIRRWLDDAGLLPVALRRAPKRARGAPSLLEVVAVEAEEDQPADSAKPPASTSEELHQAAPALGATCSAEADRGEVEALL